MKTYYDIVKECEHFLTDEFRENVHAKISLNVGPGWYDILYRTICRLKEIERSHLIRITSVEIINSSIYMKYILVKEKFNCKFGVLKPFLYVIDFTRNLFLTKKYKEIKEDINHTLRGLRDLSLNTCSKCGKSPAGQYMLGLWEHTLCINCMEIEYSIGYSKQE